jgi:hypothetical protein
MDLLDAFIRQEDVVEQAIKRGEIRQDKLDLS